MTAPNYSPIHDHNRRAWNRMVQKGQRFTRPAKDADLSDPLGTVDGLNWLGGDINGMDVLCLAAGGGKQGAIYAAAGGRVTVVDISDAMLELDRQVAAERKLPIQTVEASMDNLSMFAPQSFDIVIHPVSTCYVPDIAVVFQQVARVTRPGGTYISQHKQPTSLQANVEDTSTTYTLGTPYYNDAPLPAVRGSRLREEGTMEFLHRWEQIIGGMCRSGFVIEDLMEPNHTEDESASGSFAHRAKYIAPYVRIKARRTSEQAEQPRILMS